MNADRAAIRKQAYKMDLLSNLPARIHGILDAGAEGDASRIAFTDEHDVDWSYRRLIDTVELAATEMSRLGIRPGDRVMIPCARIQLQRSYCCTHRAALTPGRSSQMHG